MQRKGMALRSCSCLLFFSGLLCGVWTDGLVNEDVKRTLDLSSHLAKISAEILLANPGNSAVQSFTLALEPELAPHLAYIGASVSSSINIPEKSWNIYSAFTLKRRLYTKCLPMTNKVHYIKRGRHYYFPYLCREHEDIWNSVEVLSLTY